LPKIENKTISSQRRFAYKEKETFSSLFLAKGDLPDTAAEYTSNHKLWLRSLNFYLLYLSFLRLAIISRIKTNLPKEICPRNRSPLHFHKLPKEISPTEVIHSRMWLHIDIGTKINSNQYLHEEKVLVNHIITPNSLHHSISWPIEFFSHQVLSLCLFELLWRQGEKLNSHTEHEIQIIHGC